LAVEVAVDTQNARFTESTIDAVTLGADYTAAIDVGFKAVLNAVIALGNIC
jgi:hypothetical protein